MNSSNTEERRVQELGNKSEGKKELFGDDGVDERLIVK